MSIFHCAPARQYYTAGRWPKPIALCARCRICCCRRACGFGCRRITCVLRERMIDQFGSVAITAVYDDEGGAIHRVSPVMLTKCGVRLLRRRVSRAPDFPAPPARDIRSGCWPRVTSRTSHDRRFSEDAPDGVARPLRASPADGGELGAVRVAGMALDGSRSKRTRRSTSDEFTTG